MNLDWIPMEPTCEYIKNLAEQLQYQSINVQQIEYSNQQFDQSSKPILIYYPIQLDISNNPINSNLLDDNRIYYLEPLHPSSYVTLSAYLLLINSTNQERFQQFTLSPCSVSSLQFVASEQLRTIHNLYADQNKSDNEFVTCHFSLFVKFSNIWIEITSRNKQFLQSINPDKVINNLLHQNINFKLFI